MKRLPIVLPLVATSCVFLLYKSADHDNPFSFERISQKQENMSNAIIKYEDCIQEESLIELRTFLKRENKMPVGEDLAHIDIQIGKYRVSLDSTIQNLNSIDAHSFLHIGFKRSKQRILNSELSAIRTYYHLEIMEACYAKDKELNQSSQNSLTKL